MPSTICLATDSQLSWTVAEPQKRRSPHLESWKGMNVKKRRSECQAELVWMKIDEVSVLNAHMLHGRLYPELTPADSEIFMEPIMKAPDRRN